MSKTQFNFRVHALTIDCSDYDKSVEFYEDTLGAEPLEMDSVLVSVVRWFRLGDLKITLIPNSMEPNPAELGVHAHTMLWLEVDNLTEVNEELVNRGVTVLHPCDGDYMMIADPNGIPIEIWQRQEE